MIGTRAVPVIVGAVVAAVVFTATTGGERSPLRADGAALFVTKRCSTCHTGPDSQARVGEFPNLADAAVWAGTRRPGLDAAGYIAESLLEPSLFIAPGYRSNGLIESMPSLRLNADEVTALVEYLVD